MSENFRIERGWIYVNGTRQDDGSWVPEHKKV